MVRIRPHLDALVPEIQREVGAALSGLLTGAVVRSNLPQVWVFETEEETVTLMVDGEGNVSTLEGAPSTRTWAYAPPPRTWPSC